MKLVIVESPSKAKTINKYLGKDYKVIASYGHIRQLPSKNGSVDPEKNFEMTWEETIQAKKYIKSILQSVKEAEEIYLATDPDREGEAISWHLYSYLKDKKALKGKAAVKRVVFNSITKENILQAFKNSREIDDNLVSSYLARLSLDYLVGFGISPILWRKMPGSRSAGRVQSVALRIICEREQEIEEFVPVEYWSILTNLLDGDNNELKAKIFKVDGNLIQKDSVSNQVEAEKIKKDILSRKFTLSEIENKNLTRNPFAPFTTSTLQQDSFNKLGFSAKRTMQLAQKLYEGIKIGKDTQGLITYMRTDATQIDPSFIEQIRDHVEKKYGKKYLAKNVRVYKTKAKNAQEAHEAIRPTSIANNPDSIKEYLEEDLFKLYSLIWKRSIASQMESALYDICVYTIKSQDEYIHLKASGSILTFDGFYKLYKVDKEEEDNLLPKINLNTELSPKEVDLKQHFSEPPSRYSEATLVKKLEEIGIGRPSTYANIISVLQDRKYTRLEKKRFVPEARGRILNIFLTQFFTNYVEYNFTANLEEELDLISSGNKDWKEILNKFWVSFNDTTKKVSAISNMEVMEAINKTALKHFVGEETKCPKCKVGDLQIKNSKFGAFIGCSNYPTCTYTQQLEISNDNEEDSDREKSMDTNMALGVDTDEKEIFLKKGPYGYYLEKADTKPKRIALPKGIEPENITLFQARFLLSLPIKLDNKISFSIGKFGPYIKEGSNFYSYKGDIFTIDLKSAKEIIDQEKIKKEGQILGSHPSTQTEIALKNGRFGVYLKYGNKNVKIPKEYKSKTISLEDAISIINEAE